MVMESELPTIVQLDNDTGMCSKYLSFLEDYNITAHLKKGGRGSGWFASEEKISTIIQLLSSMLITVPFILKSIHVALLIYLSLKELLKMIILVYYMVCQINIYIYS